MKGVGVGGRRDGREKKAREKTKIAGQKLTSQRRRGRDLCDYVFMRKGALVAERQLSGTGHAEGRPTVQTAAPRWARA